MSHCACVSKRRFMAQMLMAAGASCVPAVLWSAAKQEQPVLLLTCPDPRLVPALSRYLQQQQLDSQSVLSLTGASLGAVKRHLPFCDPQRFWQLLSRNVQPAQPSKLIVLDHQDCTTYRMVFGQEACRDQSNERRLQQQQHQLLAVQLRERYPELSLESLWMSSSGEISQLV